MIKIITREYNDKEKDKRKGYWISVHDSRLELTEKEKERFVLFCLEYGLDYSLVQGLRYTTKK